MNFESKSILSMSATFLFALTIATVSVLRSGNGENNEKASTEPVEKKSESKENSKFLDLNKVTNLKETFGSPIYVYDEQSLLNQARKALHFPNSYGLAVRYAMKACPNAAILQLFNQQGINFDASSGFEVWRAIKAGIQAQNISLSSQELPTDFQILIEQGIEFNACSLKQLEAFGKLNRGGSCGVRFNPGTGSGGTGKTVSHFVHRTFRLQIYCNIFIIECRRTGSIIWNLVRAIRRC
jgi:hypothetical protein